MSQTIIPGKKLEQYKAFPYIAWVVFIGFTVFVYGITIELSRITSELNETTLSLEARIQNNFLSIEELTKKNKLSDE